LFLPLHRDTFQILVSLADQDRHGFAVMRDVLERTDGALRLSPSTLYASIRSVMAVVALIAAYLPARRAAPGSSRRGAAAFLVA
jgi:hypothetical protein